jgi:16S rRNA (cytosine967-C5)-methyltransferase
MQARYLASQYLYKIIYDKKSLADITFPAEEKEAAYIQHITYNVLRWYHQLNVILHSLLEKPLKNKDNDIYCILLIGLYEIFHTDKPEYVIVNETVSCANLAKKTWAKGLINAVLRRSLREKEQILAESAKDIEGKYSHPKWLIALLQKTWPDHWKTILEANNQLPPMWLRVNQQKISTEKYQQLLLEKEIHASVDSALPNALLLAEPCKVTELPQFFEGFCSVQDAAGQFAASFLDLQTGMRVLDACAAPGSKTCHILESNPQIEVTAIEKAAQRAVSLEENLHRLKLTAKIIIDDAINIRKWWDNQPFDRILIDAPCSSIGVIRRHPDIKLLRQETDLDNLVNTQKELLTSLWEVLKPQGKLLYSTCSILAQENSEVIQWFLEQTPDAKLIPLFIQNSYDTGFGNQMFPGEAGRDGFFYALLEKGGSC